MSELTRLSKAELIEWVRNHRSTLDSPGSEPQEQRLRGQDIAIQTKDQAIEQLTPERDECKLA